MRPTRTALWAAVALLVACVAAAIWPQGLPACAGAALLLLGLLVNDARALRGPPTMVVDRRIPDVMTLGQRYEVAIIVRGRLTESVLLYDHAHPACQVWGMPQALALHPGQTEHAGYATYTVRPMQRGELVFEAVSLQLRGPARMLERLLRLDVRSTIRVYPNPNSTSRHRAVGELSRHQGVSLTRTRGQGLEFHQLREFREGDSMRQVDWKTVARRQQLVSREYRCEQNQSVVFLLDCGRRMRACDGDFTLLDQALGAMLQLCQVALRQGDAVGVLTFGGPTRWLAPVRGARAISRLLAATYDLASTTDPSDFEEAVLRFSARQRKRCLVVVLSSVGDDDADSLLTSLGTLRPRHKVVLASLCDPALATALQREVGESDDGLFALSTMNYLGSCRRARARLSATGLTVLEAEPVALPRTLVDHYLRVKRAGAL